MPHDRLAQNLNQQLRALDEKGTRKGHERVIRAVIPAADGRGPRYLIDGEGERPFLRMNANNYLGLSLDAAMIEAEEAEVSAHGTGPGAVRFISGTWKAHTDLETHLAAFHGREAAMIYSSAYAAMMGLLPPLISDQTAVISDELNHNCIINAVRLGAPKQKRIYSHLAMDELERHLEEAARDCDRAIIVTDGIFSMRGDYAPLDQINALARAHDANFSENVLVLVDDSHGVGAFGKSGRGTEEVTGSAGADILLATLGKAFGVNGGYFAASETLVAYLRETSPFYIYSNPITQGEAAAAAKALEIVGGPRGGALLEHLGEMKARFEAGLIGQGLETIKGVHPITPLMIRDTDRTTSLVAALLERGVLATGIIYPVVPRGDEAIRFQICADHTASDIDEALGAIAAAIAAL